MRVGTIVRSSRCRAVSSAHARSPNGWEMEKVADGGGTIWTRPVPGTPLEGVAVRIGEVESLLVDS